MQERREMRRAASAMREPCQVKGCNRWAQVWDGSGQSGYCVECWRAIRELEELAFIEPAWNGSREYRGSRSEAWAVIVSFGVSAAVAVGLWALWTYRDAIGDALARWFGGE